MNRSSENTFPGFPGYADNSGANFQLKGRYTAACFVINSEANFLCHNYPAAIFNQRLQAVVDGLFMLLHASGSAGFEKSFGTHVPQISNIGESRIFSQADSCEFIISISRLTVRRLSVSRSSATVDSGGCR